MRYRPFSYSDKRYHVGLIQAFWLPSASVYARAFEKRWYFGRFTARHGQTVYYKLQYGIVCAAWDEENARKIIDLCTLLREHQYKILQTSLLTVWNQNCTSCYKGRRTSGRTAAKCWAITNGSSLV
ncbi:hypothetical protein BDR22DRAFT_871969 [Usnea florida]